MARSTTMFVCNVCGYEVSKWYGRCPQCQAWNSFQEIHIEKESYRKKRPDKETKIYKIGQIKTNFSKRSSTGLEEFDRVLGGGIVPGEVVLLSGDPGIGKSTLLLQVALDLAYSKNHTPKAAPVLYVSGEESEDQIKIRSVRLVPENKLNNSDLFVLSTSDIEKIISVIREKKPFLVIIDSIQTMASSELPGFPGSIPQVRYCTQVLLEIAKNLAIPIFLVGHVTKEGIVAGPMLLSHMVDAVLYLEGERFSGTRILRSFKNRFGDISEVGLFIMEEKGLRQIQDASTFFFDKNDQKVPGSCVSVIIEGSRPILIEFQALTVPSSLSFPRRIVSGLPDKRVELLLAVIQKHLRLPLDKTDVFVNVTGGLRIFETAADLAVCLAVISSFKNKPLGKIAAISEVGLLGELRNVIQLGSRIIEAKKFGLTHIITSKDFKTLSNVVQSIL